MHGRPWTVIIPLSESHVYYVFDLVYLFYSGAIEVSGHRAEDDSNPPTPVTVVPGPTPFTDEL